jgi:hypothetical protein
MTLRCCFGHQLGGFVARGRVLHVRCTRCDRLSPGITLDRPQPRVTQPVRPVRSRIWWLRGVFEHTKGA